MARVTRWPQLSEACGWRNRPRAALWQRLAPNVPLADLFKADTLPVNYDSHCCRYLGFPVTGHFYGEVSRSARQLA
jgi:hypothetical protein